MIGEVHGHLQRDPDGGWRFRWDLDAVRAAYAGAFRPAVAPPRSVPTLIVRAARVDAVQSGFLVACRVESDVTVVDMDCGHMVLEERPLETLALMRDFLEPVRRAGADRVG